VHDLIILPFMVLSHPRLKVVDADSVVAVVHGSPSLLSIVEVVGARSMDNSNTSCEIISTSFSSV
jgi:hypothetical protein